ncbi:MAG: phosphoglucosamine mutase, partial [Candidatus Hodarchaeota archaeon]
VLDETVEREGGIPLRTPVGDIQVAVKMKEIGATFGGEACGVFIFSDFLQAPEPFLTTCRILELMAKTENSFAELISEVPVYPLLKTKLSCSNEKKQRVMDVLTKKLPDTLQDVIDVLTVDGLGVSLKSGWVLVRPSGTEPVIRITCEATTQQEVEQILADAKTVVEKVISEV